MRKSKTSGSGASRSGASRWVRTLRVLMEQQGYNPRSLSLKAGLNATAVRDMLEGRTRYPRYDTARGLAKALDTTPANLMGDAEGPPARAGAPFMMDDDLLLLEDIIAKLQAAIEEHRARVPARNFASIAATLYRRLRAGERSKRSGAALRPFIENALDQELRRTKSRHG